jgi:hypothetical protein
MSKKVMIFLAAISFVFAYLCVSLIIGFIEKGSSKSKKDVWRSGTYHREYVRVMGITNWVVVTSDPGPTGTFYITSKGSDMYDNEALVYGFSGKSIPPGTPVRFLWVFFSSSDGLGPNSVHFVEPVQ